LDPQTLCISRAFVKDPNHAMCRSSPLLPAPALPLPPVKPIIMLYCLLLLLLLLLLHNKPACLSL
jgi:hypothetical protein